MNLSYKNICTLLFVFIAFTNAKAQDLPVMQMSIGASSNISLFSNKIKNGGAYFSLEYLINRNIFAGVQADYIVGQNKIQLNNPSFSNAVTFSGDTFIIKENISKMCMGVYGGYRFFPLNDVIINVGLSANNISLNRKFKDKGDLSDASVAWYGSNWSKNSATVIGFFTSFDFSVSKTTMLRAGLNYQDITNSLFEGRDQNIIKEIGYTDKRINTMVNHKKPFETMDVFLALVFKLGIKKL